MIFFISLEMTEYTQFVQLCKDQTRFCIFYKYVLGFSVKFLFP